MSPPRSVAAVAALFALSSACPAAPPAASPAADLDRVRGCWIQRVEPDGKATRLLRLLPDHDRPGWLGGQIQRADGDDPDRRLQLEFSRDGERASLTRAAPAADAGGSAPQGLVQQTRTRIDFVRVLGAGRAVADAASGATTLEYRASAGAQRLRIEVEDERLHLSIDGLGPLRPRRPPIAQTLFDGRRDGCD
ncbi:hypothetical protein K4L06_16030 [Lysobacter sp. BMK333-48F3]|uniref:hypothetical protein n=1 Tax=Lysobacter sp. BMK333-48F3 TaxID=2867962 RepID=UPI001C8B20F8|nr:hypothetical protein [Lysobacter sp. BMK333-48F3]MBX9402819.1 hypothetical protein [Lysobacter sp. BMK333-48F3]